MQPLDNMSLNMKFFLRILLCIHLAVIVIPVSLSAEKLEHRHQPSPASLTLYHRAAASEVQAVTAGLLPVVFLINVES